MGIGDLDAAETQVVTSRAHFAFAARAGDVARAVLGGADKGAAVVDGSFSVGSAGS